LSFSCPDSEDQLRFLVIKMLDDNSKFFWPIKNKNLLFFLYHLKILIQKNNCCNTNTANIWQISWLNFLNHVREITLLLKLVPMHLRTRMLSVSLSLTTYYVLYKSLTFSVGRDILRSMPLITFTTIQNCRHA
jgi:hypothetical protein